MFIQPVQRQRLIQNLIELESEAADNDVAVVIQTAEEKNETILGQAMVGETTISWAVGASAGGTAGRRCIRFH